MNSHKNARLTYARRVEMIQGLTNSGMSISDAAVAWAAMALDTVNQRFTLNVPKAVLKDAPGFNKVRWPSMSDNTWATGVHKFYGTPYSTV